MRVPRAVGLSRHLCAAPLFVLAVFALIANRGDRVAAQEPPPAAANKLRPTGTILFMVNGEVIGSATGVMLTATGSNTARATFTTSVLAHGTHTVTATYLGDPNDRGVASTISLTVN